MNVSILLPNFYLYKVMSAAILVSLLFAINASHANTIQDYEIYTNGESFTLRGQVDREVIEESTSAAELIQSAIDRLADDGGEVMLHRGLYTLDAPLNLKKRVTLRGKGRGTKLVVSSKNEKGIGIIIEETKAAVVANLSLEPHERHALKAGILLEHSGECKIRDVLVKGFGEYGIWIRNHSFLCEISSSEFADNNRANVFFDDLRKGRAGRYLPNLLTNCMIYGGTYGVEGSRALVVSINDCVFVQNQKHAIYLHNSSNSVLISGCRTYQIEDDAVFVENSHEVNIVSNIFCWHRGHGIVLERAKWGSIASNNIIDSGVRALDEELRNGIVLRNNTKGIQVTSNALFNWGDQVPMKYGIIEDSSCVKNLISHNSINYFENEGVKSEGENSIAKDNIFEGEIAWLGMNKKGFPDFSHDLLRAYIDE